MQDERNELTRKIERLKAEIKAAEDKIDGLDDGLPIRLKLPTLSMLRRLQKSTAKTNLQNSMPIKKLYRPQNLNPKSSMRKVWQGT